MKAKGFPKFDWGEVIPITTSISVMCLVIMLVIVLLSNTQVVKIGEEVNEEAKNDQNDQGSVTVPESGKESEEGLKEDIATDARVIVPHILRLEKKIDYILEEINEEGSEQDNTKEENTGEENDKE